MSGHNDHTGTDAAKDKHSRTVREPLPSLDQRIQEAIGRSLKAHYDDLVQAPVPDKLLALLAALEAKEGQRGI